MGKCENRALSLFAPCATRPATARNVGDWQTVCAFLGSKRRPNPRLGYFGFPGIGRALGCVSPNGIRADARAFAARPPRFPALWVLGYPSLARVSPSSSDCPGLSHDGLSGRADLLPVYHPDPRFFRRPFRPLSQPFTRLSFLPYAREARGSRLARAGGEGSRGVRFLDETPSFRPV